VFILGYVGQRQVAKFAVRIVEGNDGDIRCNDRDIRFVEKMQRPKLRNARSSR